MSPCAPGLVRKRIYLLRHGEVSYFDARGRPVDPRAVRLTETGIAQIEAVGALLAEAAIDRAVCSGLPRTRQTAEIALAGRPVPIEDEPDLREIKGGRFADVPPERARALIANAFRGAGDDAARFFHGGESFGAFGARVTAAFERALRRPAWDRLLVSGHDGVNRVILCWAAGAGRGAMAAFEQDHGGLSIIDIDVEAESGAIAHRMLRCVNLTPADPAKHRTWATSMEPIHARYLEAREKGHL